MSRLAVATLALVASPTAANVVQATATGFEVSHSVIVAVPLERAWPIATAPRLWWNKDHTYSGDSANLTLDERPGGCFCEKLAGKGGVEHMRVVYIQPPRMIRLAGALGPLQAEGATGAMAITLTKQGDGTKIDMSYVVGGYARQGMEKLAPLVDRVLGEQFVGLKAAIEGAGASAAAKLTPARPAATPKIDAEPLAEVGATISGLPAEGEPRAADPPKPEATPKDPSVEPESPR